MIPYDIHYYYNLLRIQAGTARDVMGKRYEFIRKHITKLEEGQIPTRDWHLLDYGCGIGAMKSFAPFYFNVDTFDIMPVPQTGVTRKEYDIVTMYDVLEHIPDFQEVQPVLKKANFVVISVPIKPENVDWNEYKHFKPGEHLHYFTGDLLDHIFSTMGFLRIAHGWPECPPREFIESFIYKRTET